MRTGIVRLLGIAFLFSAMMAQGAEPAIGFETPKEVELGKAFTVKIKVRGATADQGLKLGADLHCMKANGVYGGFMAWGGNHRAVSGDRTFTFTYKAGAKKGLLSVMVTAFLSKTGNFKDALLNTLPTTGKTILFTSATLTLGVITWLFSQLRFQANMGLLLGFLFMLCMLTMLTVAPSLTAVIRPKFIFGQGEKEGR